MRVRHIAMCVVFAVALVAIYFSGQGWSVYATLVVGVSMLGGWLIGRRWAVGVAVGTNLAFSAIVLLALSLHWGVDAHGLGVGAVALFYLGQLLASAVATGAAVRLRTRAVRPAGAR